jgi:hypothetical protein
VVAAVEEQPLSIWYEWDEEPGFVRLLEGPSTSAFRKLHRASYVIPDFLVTTHGGQKRLVEIKPLSKLARLDVRRKFHVGRLFAERNGWSFHVVTERELLAGPLSANVRLVNRFRRSNIDAWLLKRIEALVVASAITLGELSQGLADIEPAIVRAAVLHLIAVGRLDLDPAAAPISKTTLIFPGGTQPWDPFDSVWGPSGSSTSVPTASSGRRVPTSSSPKT